jgi:TRAP-type uncharacterized transport system substrate-binding protein
MKKVFPTGYMGTIQPAPNLAGVKEPMPVMHYDYTVFANADVPADKIKRLTQLIAEHQSELASLQPSFRGLKPERMYTDTGVPYHDGAIAYYKEKGIQPGK